MRVGSVVDERKGKEDLGMFGGHVVEGRQVLPWLQQAVERLNTPEVEVRSPRQSYEDSTSAPSYRTAATVSPLTSVSATSLVQAQYQIHQEPPYSQQYRGTDTRGNWTGTAKGSMRTLFNDVLDDVVRQIHADIQQHCQSGQAKSGT